MQLLYWVKRCTDAVPSCAVLWRAVLRCAVLRCAVLRSAVLCCAGLGWAGLGWAGFTGLGHAVPCCSLVILLFSHVWSLAMSCSQAELCYDGH